MKEMYTPEFWHAIDQLISSSEIIIDRPKGSRHPRIPHIIYPLDYGYLKGTLSMDKDGIDLWRGSLPAKSADALIITVDLMKRDSEIKLLIGLTEEEKQTALDFHNDSIHMKGILVRRDFSKGLLNIKIIFPHKNSGGMINDNHQCHAPSKTGKHPL